MFCHVLLINQVQWNKKNLKLDLSLIFIWQIHDYFALVGQFFFITLQTRPLKFDNSTIAHTKKTTQKKKTNKKGHKCTRPFDIMK